MRAAHFPSTCFSASPESPTQHHQNPSPFPSQTLQKVLLWGAPNSFQPAAGGILDQNPGCAQLNPSQKMQCKHQLLHAAASVQIPNLFWNVGILVWKGYF